MRPAFGEIGPAALERRVLAGIVNAGPLLEIEDAGKLRQKLTASLAYGSGKFGIEIGEVQERRRRAEFLPLKEHRGGRHQQHQRRESAPPTRARELVSAQATRRIRNL